MNASHKLDYCKTNCAVIQTRVSQTIVKEGMQVLRNTSALHLARRLRQHSAIAAAATSLGMLLTIATAGPAAAVPEWTERSCYAADSPTFSICVDRATRGKVDHLVLMGRIQCDRELPCGYVLRGISRPLTIVGGVAEAGFSRAADGGSGFGLRIEKSSGPIVVRGLQFSMGRSAAQGIAREIWTDPSCPARDSCPEAAITIAESTDVLIDQVQIIDAKRFGIAIVGVSSLTIRRSTFVRSGLHGIWVAKTPASRGLHIENDQFIDIRSNAAMLSGLAPDASDPLRTNTVTGNLFEHNHNAAVYHACGPSGNEPCAGSQLVIVQQSDSFLIADNEFRHGILDEDLSMVRDFRVAGVEIAPAYVHNVTIRHNYFYDLSAGAITVDSPAVASELRVVDNVFRHVGGRDPEIGEVGRAGENHGNCQVTAPGCVWERPIDRLGWEPCILKGNRECSAIIEWHGQRVKALPRVIIDSRRVFVQSNVADGERIASWTGAVPIRFDLYAGATLLDTLRLGIDRGLRVLKQD